MFWGLGLAVYNNEAFSLIFEYVCFLCGWIMVFVFFCLFCQVFFDCGVSAGVHESRVVELVWTFLPTVAVVCLCLCNVGCNLDYGCWAPSQGVIKVIGHQWYWEVEQFVLGKKGVHFDSAMTDFVSSVDKPIVVELGKPYQLVVTSADVIHSLSCMGLGLKMDGCPGRVNMISLLVDSVGVYVGYCTELCGAGHAYMPVVFECVDSA